MKENTKVIMIMLDGFGVPPEGWEQSYYAKHCSNQFISLFKDYSKPIDACLGIEGVPQSATGQTALFTGFNGADIMGRHTSGFPGPLLKEAIQERNIFTSLDKANYTVTFANAYVRYNMKDLRKTRFRSVTTVMTEGIFGAVRRKADLIEHYAVYHDITREGLQDGKVAFGRQKFKLEPPIPELITVEEGARDLIKIARGYDFTLFEYFMTDKAGHSGEEEFRKHILNSIDRFICTLVNEMDQDMLLLITADHGNLEEPEHTHHTVNPVPLFLYGHYRPDTIWTESLIDVHPFILEMMLDLNSPDKDYPDESNDHIESEDFADDNPFANLF